MNSNTWLAGLVYSEQRYLQITNWFPGCHDGKLLIKQISCSEYYRLQHNDFLFSIKLFLNQQPVKLNM